MRVSSYSDSYASGFVPPPSPAAPSSGVQPVFERFCAQAIARAQARGVPVLLVIGDVPDAFLSDPSLALLIAERTVPVRLVPGERPDVELLCQRAGALFSGGGALPLCALLHDGLPFLAAPLPPAGFPLDPAQVYAWLAQADRRFTQNRSACASQASQVIRSFRAESPAKPYLPRDAAHDLTRALLAIEDKQSGGFGQIKSPFVCALRFVQHAAARGDHAAHAALTRTLDAMLSSPLYDPLDGACFRAALTDDWRVFVPEKPLGINALLALILLDSGRRSEAVRMLDFIIDAFALQGGGLSPVLSAPRASFAFSPEQVCAALGSENGLRACRLLGLLRQHAGEEPAVAPSRFSPVLQQKGRRLSMDAAPLCPTLSPALTPEDAAFLRRILPTLLRARAAREPQRPAPYVLTEHCALAAAVLAQCGKRLGEPRYTQAAQRAVSFLLGLPSSGEPSAAPLPASISPASPLLAQATCGASAALALALLTLGQAEEAYAQRGFALLGRALHAFVRTDSVVMHTSKDDDAFFPRIPAIYDSELPSPAALLTHALRLAHQLRPQAHYDEAIDAIWHAAAPAAHAQPMACASLIDAVNY